MSSNLAVAGQVADADSLVLNPISKAVLVLRVRQPTSGRRKWIFYEMRQRPEFCRLFFWWILGLRDQAVPTELRDELVHELFNDGMLVQNNRMGLQSRLLLLRRGIWRKCPPDVPRFAYRGEQLQLNMDISRAYVLLSCKKRGEFPKEEKLPTEHGPAVLDLFSGRNPRDVLGTMRAQTRDVLVRRGLLVPKDDVPEVSGLVARAAIDALGQHTPPASQGKPTDWGRYIVNKSSILQEGTTLHPNVAKGIYNPDWMKRNLPHVWVRDEPRSILHPYWLTEAQLSLVKLLVADKDAVADLDTATFHLFTEMRILIPPSANAQNDAQWKRQLDEGRAAMNSDGSALLRGVYGRLDSAILANYVRHLLEGKYLEHDVMYGTKQRYWVVNDDLTFQVQWQVCKVINQILAKPMKPATNYLTHYRPGAVLKRHTDNGVPMCPYAVSLTLDVSPREARPWPLCVAGNGKTQTYAMEAGDAVVFSPSDPHWRQGKLVGQDTSVMLFWFVEAGFTGFVNEHYIR